MGAAAPAAGPLALSVSGVVSSATVSPVPGVWVVGVAALVGTLLTGPPGTGASSVEAMGAPGALIKGSSGRSVSPGVVAAGAAGAAGASASTLSGTETAGTGASARGAASGVVSVMGALGVSVTGCSAAVASSSGTWATSDAAGSAGGSATGSGVGGVRAGATA